MTTPRPSADAGRAGEDAVLAAAVESRDADALHALYDRYGRPCFSLARRVLGDDGLAQDVVQDVFLTLWRDAHRFDPARGGFASWLLAMTHHKAVDAVRREESRRKRRAPMDVLESATDEGASVSDEVWSGVRRDRLRSALRGLPEPQRQALGLAYFGGYTQREIAGITGTPLGTVKTRMLLGMRRLRTVLDGINAGEESADQEALS